MTAPIGSGEHGTHTTGITSGFGVPASNGTSSYDASQFMDSATHAFGKIPADSYFDSEDPNTPSTFTVFHGMAPADQVYMYKVCSSAPGVNSCGTIPMIEAVDRALDPNQTGNLNNHVDAISMSIGGPEDSDVILDQAFNNAVASGVPTAISAGNSSDQPFIVGSPSTAASVLSVASLTASVNNSRPLYGLSSTTAAANNIPFVWQPWSGALTNPGVTAEAVLADPNPNTGQPTLGCPDPSTGLYPYPQGQLTGKIAIINRGTCAISDKVYAAEQAGAVGAIVVSQAGNVPAAASLGTFQPTIPGVMIANAPGQPLIAAVNAGTVNLTIGSGNLLGSLADVMSGFSSRGPSRTGTLKPDISAPGDGVVSAYAGSLDQGINFSGTSMAAPHVGGSLILLRELHPTWTAQELEAELMNTASPNGKVTDFSSANFGLAPITRQGAGRLAVDKAASSNTVILAGPIASLSYGEPAVSSASKTFTQTMTIENKGASGQQNYTFSSEFRPDLLSNNSAIVLADQPTMPGVTISFSVPNVGSVAGVTLGPGQSQAIQVNMTINPTQLLSENGTWRWLKNFIDIGRISSLTRLDQNEIAGFVDVAESGGQTYHVPFQALPRQASAVTTSATLNQATSNLSSLSLHNGGVNNGTTELFNLGSIDPQDASPLIGLNNVPTQSSAEFDIKELAARYQASTIGPGTGLNYGPTYQFAISTYDARPNPWDAEFDTYVDVNNDGKPDFIVFNTDPGNITGAGVTGQSCTFVENLATHSLVDFGSVPIPNTNSRYPVGNCVVGSDSQGNPDGYAFYTDTQPNSANLIQTVPASAFGLSGPAKISYFTYSFPSIGVTLQADISGSPPVDVAPDKFAAVFDPSRQLFTPVAQTVGTTASQTVPVAVTTNTSAIDTEVGVLSYYQNNDPSILGNEASYVITRRGFQNLLFTYVKAPQAAALAHDLQVGNFTAFKLFMTSYLHSGSLTATEYSLLMSLFNQVYSNT